MYRLYSEWDIGEGNLIFASREVGVRWLYDNEAIKEMAADEKASVPAFVESLFAEGFLTWEPLEVIA